MLTNEQQEFYNRWMAKAAAINPATIAEYIDKYVTLFITYNSLYSAIPQKLTTAGHAGISTRDKEGATTNVIRLIGATNILSSLSGTGNDKDIVDLANTLQAQIFHIKFTPAGNHVPAEDATLETDLLSANPDTKALAILKVIYYVRCNIFHGRKDLHPFQEILVSPLVNILSSLNVQLYNALIVFPH
jgi:hypothetical protein